jgi:proline iminopeptidase
MRADDGVELVVRRSGSAANAALVQLSGGPGCVNYLPDAGPEVPVRALSPQPRGVGSSGGGPHGIARALADLEDLRRAVGVERWLVLGHSFGADLALAYAVEYPDSVAGVLSVCGTGIQNDRDWKAAYDAARETEPAVDIEYDEAVHRSLLDSWRRWIKRPDLLARLGRLTVPVRFVVAGGDIRPSWPVEQLAALVPDATLHRVPAVPHDFWYTHPDVWRELVAAYLRG